LNIYSSCEQFRGRFPWQNSNNKFCKKFGCITTKYWFFILQVNSFVGAFHDAVILYAIALNETLAANMSITNGTEITRRMWNRTFSGTVILLCTIKPVLGSHPREAQKVAAYGRWLLSGGEYQYKIYVWERSVLVLKTGWLLNKGER